MKRVSWWSRPVDRRLVFAVMPLVVLVAVYALGLLRPAWAWATFEQERLATARFDWDRAQRTLDAGRRVPTERVVANEQWLKQHLSPGNTEAEAREALLQRVTALPGVTGAERLSYSLQATQRLTDRYALLAVQVVGELAERDAFRFVAALEALEPRVKVSKWTLRGIGRWRGGTEVGVQISLVVSAPWRVPDASASGSPKGGRP